MYCTNLNGGKQYYKEKQSIFIIDLNSTTSVVGNNTCTTKRNSTILLIVLYKLQWWVSILQRVTVQISLLYCTNFNGGHRYFKEKWSHSHYCTELTSNFNGGHGYFKKKQSDSHLCTVQTSAVGMDT